MLILADECSAYFYGEAASRPCFHDNLPSFSFFLLSLFQSSIAAASAVIKIYEPNHSTVFLHASHQLVQFSIQQIHKC